MTKFIIVIVFFIIAFLLEGSSLRKQKRFSDLYIFSFLMFLAFGLSILYILKIPIPNPLVLINYMFMPVANWIYGLLN
jgi:hypothetical protein